MHKINSVSNAANFLRNIDGSLSESQVELLRDWVYSLEAAQTIPPERGNFRTLVKDDFERCLVENGIGKSSLICEIGGPYNSFADLMPEYKFEYLSLFPAKGFDNVMVADATQCEHVSSARYDAIFSISVFEHISKPWKAARHLSRLLKPGGIVYHVAPFSYFYHGAPADYWRFTPDAFKLLFSDLKPLKAEFFGGNRRRDNRGSKANPVDQDGGEQFSVDPFGGWRENWHSIYVGAKDEAYYKDRLERAKYQVIINLVKTQMEKRKIRKFAIDAVYNTVKSLRVNVDEDLTLVERGEGNFEYSRKEIVKIWSDRNYKGEELKPSYNRYVMAAKLGWLNK